MPVQRNRLEVAERTAPGTAHQRHTGTHADAIVVGAGFGGLYALHKLRELGLSVQAFETGSDVGGVWYWNRYPGARCDVESMQYSYSFSEDLQQEWHWSERFAGQPEILQYAVHVADRLQLRQCIAFNTRIEALEFDAASSRWHAKTNDGRAYSANFVIMATGCLSAARTPDLPGLSEYRGKTYHTGAWPHDGVDFTGQRVGIVGTGSSGIQAIPEIARQASHLWVFQRTPNFSIPARNGPMEPDYERSWKDNYAALRRRARDETTSGTVYEKPVCKASEVDDTKRQREFERRWQTGGVNFMHTFSDLMTNKPANETAAAFVVEKIRSTVKAPDVADLLVPKDHPIGTKRICIDTDYFETYNRDNVSLVDVRKAPLRRLTQTGLETDSGHYELDCIVFATGYDAMTGALLNTDIKGSGGLALRDAWQDGPKSYLGLMVAGFPNLFTLTGPGSPSVLANMIFAIEQHVDWIADCLAHLRRHGVARIEASADAQDLWVQHVNEAADKTLFPTANSWYVGANIPGKPRVFMPYCGGVVPYRQKCDEVAAAGYQGFVLSAPAGTHAARTPDGTSRTAIASRGEL